MTEYNFKNSETRIIRNLNMSYNRKIKYGWTRDARPMFTHSDIQKIEMFPEMRGKIVLTINNEGYLIDLAVLSLRETEEIKRFLKCNEKVKQS